MAVFTYKAKKGPQETVVGEIKAANRQEAIANLIRSGLTPVSVEEEKKKTFTHVRKNRQVLNKRISSREVNVFTRQLSSLIRARVELLKSLNILYAQSENARFQEVISKLHESVKKGGSFSEALSGFPRLFSYLYVSLVASGEASGRLDEALESLAEFADKEEELKSKILTAMAYPALMIIVGIGTVFVLVSFVIPKLAGMFADFGQVLPLPTRILIGISSVFSRYWVLILIAAAALIAVGLKRKAPDKERSATDKIKLRLPLIGAIISKQIIVRFSNTLGLLLRSGIPVFRALEITMPTLGNGVFMQAVKDMRKEVIDGASVADSMKSKTCFPSFVSSMVGVGEEGGRLDKVLTEIASAYSREVDNKVKMATSLLEPGIILVLGLVVGFIVIAMLLPILQLTILVK